jgi:PKD repeat protein
MNQKSPPKQKIIFVLTLFALFFMGNFLSHAQNVSGVYISWNIGVGCQKYSDEDRKKVFLEEIADSECINVCQGSNVTYTLNDLPTGATTAWTVTGGTVTAQSNMNLTVNWSQIGDAEIAFVITTPSGLISKKLCIKVIKGPVAWFLVAPFDPRFDEIKVCSNQLIYFTDASSTNGGTSIVNYHWNFGDGTTTDAQNPTHSYANPGWYDVLLTVTNECNCTSTRKIRVYVDRRGFEISCASVVCEGQTSTYSLPQEATERCGGFKWTVIGGTIVGPNNNPTVDVLWNNVDADGFGFVTFNPDQCELECRISTTIRVPVILARGTITGPISLCLGEQGRYSLPQWPTTDFQWSLAGNQAGSIIQTDQRNEIIFTPTQPGIYTLVSTYRNTLVHCGGRATITINVSKPEPFIGESVVCAGGSATYTTISTLPVTWTLRNSNAGVVASLSNSNTFTQLFATAGNYTLTVSGPGICAGQVRNIVVTPALTAPTINAPVLLICPNAPYTYTVLNPVANSEYEWQITNGTITSSTTGPEVTASFLGDGQIRVRRVQISPAGCSSPFAIANVSAVTINADISNTATNLVTPTIISCSNNYITYKAINAAGGLYADSESTYVWSIIPATAGSISSGQGTNTVQVLWNNVTVATPYILSVKIKKCSVTATVNKSIMVTPIPTLTLTSNASVCSGVPITFTASTGSTPLLPNSVISWNFGNGVIVNGAAGSMTTTQTFNNGTGANIAFTVTASIVNANNCSGTITASRNFTVTPGPTANATNQTIANTFCGASNINANLLSATTSGASIVWYKGTTATQVATTPNLLVTPALGFGSYFFVATLNGCSTQSNTILIINDCINPSPCTISGNPVNSIATNNNCGVLNFTGTVAGNPLDIRWTIIGPNTNFTNVLGNNGPNQYGLTVLKAGQYTAILTVTYLSTTGTPCAVTTVASINVPYIPDFKINPVCNGNVYNVGLTDNSSFLSNVTNPQFQYEIGNSNTGPWSILANFSGIQNFNIVNQAPGSLFIRQTVRGTVGGILQPVCSKVITIDLVDVNGINISFLQPPCFDTPILFNVTNTDVIAGDKFEWTFETVGSVTVTTTNAAPTRVYQPSFAGGAVSVSVKVTTRYGCVVNRTVLFNLPARCFSGTITSTMPNATACKGSPVQLLYSPGNLPAECNIVSYRWMRNNITVGTTTANSFPAMLPGIYTVEVLSNTGCLYLSTNFIAPIFTPLPSLTLSGPATLCVGEEANLSVATNASVIEWTINNAIIGTQNAINLPNLPLGLHTITVKVTENDCEKTASQTFEVVPAPNPISVLNPVLVNNDCQAYEIKLAVAYPISGGIYNWSNGGTGSTITVNQGGAYSVTYTNAGGCSTSAQVYVPKSPKAYMWVFPEGCYSKCKDETVSLLGPTFPFNSWNWLLNQHVINSGFNTVPSNLTVQNSGTYNLQLNSGLCDFVSPPMYMTANSTCPDCDLIVKVRNIRVRTATVCTYTVLLEITHNAGPAFSASLISDNANLIINPGSVTIQPGTNSYTFTIIPINGFTGGNVSLSILGDILIDDRVKKCVSKLELNLPLCNVGQAKFGTNNDDEPLTANLSMLTLYPNPASDRVNIRFEVSQGESQVEIYDLTGRLISSFTNTDNQGVYELDLAPMATGVYVVVLRQRGTVLMQRKLQVN